MNILFRSIFFGFTVWTVVWAFAKKKRWDGHTTEEVDRFVVLATIAFGAIHVLFLMSGFIQYGDGFKINQLLVDRATGQYWIGFWMFPVAYFGLPQLLWSKTLRESKAIRLTIAAVIFSVMHFEMFVIFVTSFHRDYVPEGGSIFPLYILQEVAVGWLINLLIFAAFVVIGLKIRTRVISWRT